MLDEGGVAAEARRAIWVPQYEPFDERLPDFVVEQILEGGRITGFADADEFDRLL